MIDRLRHWLIRKLSCGDFIFLNAEFAFGGYRPKNAGPILLGNITLRLDAQKYEYGFSCGRVNRAGFIMSDPIKNSTFFDCEALFRNGDGVYMFYFAAPHNQKLNHRRKASECTK